MKRLIRIAAALAMVGTLSACAVYPVREEVVVRQGYAHWVPGHYGHWGRWHPGHWG